MARFRRNNMALRPINRIKHVVDSSVTGSAGATHPFVLALATDTPTLALTTSVETGSKINGFYIRIEAASNEAIDLGAIPNVYLAIFKNVGSNLATIDPASVGADDNKRFVIHQEMTMLENKGQGSNARTIFNGVVVIPKGMRRMGPLDKWNALVKCPALNTAYCLQAHYKEFR